MPDPPGLPVVPLREGLLQPLHYFGEFQPVPGLDVKRKPIILKAQRANLEDKPMFRLTEHPGEKRPDFGPAEQRFPVVDLGADFVPDTLLKYSWFSHINIYGIDSAFCFNQAEKNQKKGGNEPPGECLLPAEADFHYENCCGSSLA
jgi:hypothetical protein